MSPITTHVLETTHGRPAAGMAVRLERDEGGNWVLLGEGETDADGRLRTLLAADTPLAAGTYRLQFETAAFYRRLGEATFYPRVTVEFTAAPGEAHYHVPLLLSPFGYTTYRGT